MKVEICANSYESALNAQLGGADRIELCSELSVGGITPSQGILQQVVSNITIPVHVLIRPRSGDFCYSDEEFEGMKKDIEFCRSIGVGGIVSGILLPNGQIDINRTQSLIELTKPMSFTFHRAFDCLEDPLKGLQELIKLDVDRILSSGQKEKAIDGIGLLIKLKDLVEDKIIILPGSGINSSNIEEFKSAGFQEIHASASSKKDSSPVFFDTSVQTYSDRKKIEEMVKIAKNA